jgi:hypothetical protein
MPPKSRVRSDENTAQNADQAPARPQVVRDRKNGFYDAPIRALLGGRPVHLSVCGRCASFVPGGSEAAKAQQLHRAFHEQLDGLDQR